jgi:hypothetical protein
MAIGRISGPLLKSNLLRDGVDLAFETDLLYLDVVNRRIGINSAAPQYALDVVGTSRTTNLEVTGFFDIGNFTISGNTINSDQKTINFVASGGEATVYHSRLIVNDIELNGNVISTAGATNADIELRPNGTGKTTIFSDSRITGNLDVTGNITATGNITIDGNLIIGDSLSDTITINASIASDLIPETNNTYDIGSSSFRWRNLYAGSVNADTINLNTFNIGNMIFANNQISSNPGYDLVLDASGTGVVRIGNFAILDNIITNTVNNSITTIKQSGSGFFKIEGTNAFIPPKGNSSQRPTAYAIEGMMRYNTDSRALELWDGSTWASPAGTIGAVSEGTANDIAIRFALTIG